MVAFFSQSQKRNKEHTMLKFAFPGSCVDVPALLDFSIKTRQNMQNYTYQCVMHFEVSINPDLVERLHGAVIVDVEVPPEAGRPIRTNPKGSWNGARRFLRL